MSIAFNLSRGIFLFSVHPSLFFARHPAPPQYLSMLMESYCRQDDIMLKFDQEVLVSPSGCSLTVFPVADHPCHVLQGNRANKRSRAVIPTSTSQPIEDEVFSKKVRSDAAVLLDLSPEREALYQSGVHGIYSKKFADEVSPARMLLQLAADVLAVCDGAICGGVPGHPDRHVPARACEAVRLPLRGHDGAALAL